jgi:putative transcriptional regulator
MPTKKRSARSSKKSNAPAKRSRVAAGILAGLKEALAHARGEIRLPTRTYPAPVNVKAIRARSGLSQVQFAQRYGFNVRTLQQWEIGRTQPPGAVRAYLTVIDRNPTAVTRALNAA